MSWIITILCIFLYLFKINLGWQQKSNFVINETYKNINIDVMPLAINTIDNDLAFNGKKKEDNIEKQNNQERDIRFLIPGLVDTLAIPRPEHAKNQDWLGIFWVDSLDRYIMKKVKIDIVPSFFWKEEHGYNADAPAYDVQVKNENIKPIFLFSGMTQKNRTEFPVAEIFPTERGNKYSPDNMLFPGESFIVRLRNTTNFGFYGVVSVFATGTTTIFDTQSVPGMPVIADYNLCMIKGLGIANAQKIHSGLTDTEESKVLIKWVGDVDDDQKTDILIMENMCGGSVWKLYLSSEAIPGDYVGLAGKVIQSKYCV